jgi:hypothetical protein
VKKWNAQAFICLPVAILILVFAAALLFDDPESKIGQEFLGRGFGVCWFTALVVWSRARKREPAWSWLRFATTYACLALVFGLCQYVGYLQATGQLDVVIKRMDRQQQQLEQSSPRP